MPEHCLSVHGICDKAAAILFLLLFLCHFRTNFFGNHQRIGHAGVRLRNLQHIQSEFAVVEEDTHAVNTLRQLVENQARLTWQTARNKEIFIDGVTVDQNGKLCVFSGTDDRDSCSLEGAGKFSASLCLHGSAVVEHVALHGVNFPVFVVENVVAEAVDTSHIERLKPDRLHCNVAEHVPRIVAAEADTTAVDHALRGVLGEEVSVDEKENGVAQHD